MKTISDELYKAIGELTSLAAKVADMMKVMDRGLFTKEEAEALVMRDYDTFDDVVKDEDGMDSDRVVEYSTKITYSYTDEKGEPAIGQLYKYPKYLERLGVTDLTYVSYKTILETFAPEIAKKIHDDCERHDKIGEVLGHFIEQNPDITRALTDADREYAKNAAMLDISGFATVADMAAEVGFMMPTLDEIATYTYDDDPVQLDDMLANIPDALKKQIGI